MTKNKIEFELPDDFLVKQQDHISKGQELAEVQQHLTTKQQELLEQQQELISNDQKLKQQVTMKQQELLQQQQALAIAVAELIANQQGDQELPLGEDWLRRHKETVGIVSVLIAILSFVCTVYFTLSQQTDSLRKSLAEERQEQARLSRDKELTGLQAENTRLNERNNVVAALDIVSRYAVELPGTVELTRDLKDKRRIVQPSKDLVMTSTTDVLNKGTGADGLVVFRFIPNQPSINAMNALADILIERDVKKDGGTADAETARVRYADSYIAPILFAKCRDSDPTAAAGALLCASHILNGRGLRAMAEKHKVKRTDGSEPFSDAAKAFAGAHFVRVDFSEMSPDFHGFNLQSADFHAARLARANLSECKLDGANFEECELKMVDFHDIRYNDNSVGPPVFNRAHFVDCTQFQKAVLSGARLNNAFFHGHCTFGSLDHDTALDGANFTGCSDEAQADNDPGAPPLIRYRYGVVTFLRANLVKSIFDDAKFGQLVRFQLCNLDGATFQNTSIGDGRFETADSVAPDATIKTKASAGIKRASAKGAIFRLKLKNETGGDVAHKLHFSDVDLTGADLGSSALSLDQKSLVFSGCTLDWARLNLATCKDTLRDWINYTNGVGEPMGKVLGEGASIVLVKNWEPLSGKPANDPGHAPLYVFAGTVAVDESHTFTFNQATPETVTQMLQAFWNSLKHLKDEKLQELGLAVGDVKCADMDSFKRNLEANVSWRMQCP